MRALLQAQSYVQSVLDQVGSSITLCERQVVGDIVRGISVGKSVLLSEISRATTDGTREGLLRQETRLSRELSKEGSGLDLLPDAYLTMVVPVARSLDFVTVDGSEVVKLYGRAFEHLCGVRDGSVPGRPTRAGYWMISIEATDGERRHLPLVQDIYSTTDPAYQALGEDAWDKTFQRGIEKVMSTRGSHGTWLFDRGFDGHGWIDYLHNTVRLSCVVRMRSSRKLEVGDVRNPMVTTVKKLASGLAKPYSVDTPYVNKSTHKLEYFRRSFTYVPVRVPGTMRRLWLIVVKGRKEDWYLLCNEEEMNAERASQIVLAYLLRWGNEEVTRCFKQCTGAEKFRVRKLVAIRRLLFLAMLALATQALLLFLEPREAKRIMASVQAFIRDIPFPHYRLWDGMAIVLKGAT